MNAFKDWLNGVLSNLILEEGVPAHDRGVRTGWSVSSLPTQVIYDSMTCDTSWPYRILGEFKLDIKFLDG